MQYGPYNVFLLNLYLWDVLFKNLNDATLSSLGNPHNMQIKTAMIENLDFANISVAVHGINIILVSYPVFWGVRNQIKSFLLRSHQYFVLSRHIKAAITKNLIFVNILVTTNYIKIILVSINMF